VKRAQKEEFERAGWKLGTASELLGMTEAEEALVEAKLQLGDAVRALRTHNQLSQAALAKRMGSSQPRVAKVENRDPEVSMDLLMKGVFAASPEARRDFQSLLKKWLRVATPTVKSAASARRPSSGKQAHARRVSRTAEYAREARKQK
jgi:predicted XRE-type DNA-binding protein